MSDANRHTLSIIPEATYAGAAVGAAFTPVRQTGTTLGLSKQTQVSEELRADRQIADHRHGVKNVAGDINFELSYGSFDYLLASLLMADVTGFTPEITSSLLMSVEAADDSYNLPVGAASNFIKAGFRAGDEVTVAGFTTVANNGVKTVVSVTATKMVVSPATLEDEAAGDDINIISNSGTTEVFLPGTTRRSFQALRNFADITEDATGKPWHLFKGCEVNTLSLSVTPDAIVTGSFGIIGKSLTLSAAIPGGFTVGSATTTKVFNAFTGSLKEGGATIGVVTGLTLSVENGLEPRFVVGSDETLQPQSGRINATGSIDVYFDSATMLEKFINETYSSLELVLEDPDGNTLTIVVPHISYTGGQPDVSGPGSISLSMPFQVILDPSSGTNLIFIKQAA